MNDGDSVGTDPLVIDGVSKRYGSVVAVDDVTLEIEPGSYHCLIGPNGSGKSTLLRLVLGLTRPDVGRISRPDGIVGAGFQEPNYYPGLTVRENISVFASIVGTTDREWIQRLVDELRLNPALDRTARELSGGFSRKLDLALALLKRPDFLLLDEPLGALDDVSKVRLLEFLHEYAEGGNTILVSTHEVTAFESSLDRATLMYDGRIVFDSPVDDLDVGEDESLQSHYVANVLAREGVESERSILDRKESG